MMFTTKKKTEEPATSAPSVTANPQAPRKEEPRPALDPRVTQLPHRPADDPRQLTTRAALEEISPSLPNRGPGRPSKSQNSTNSVMNPHLSFEGDMKYSGSLTIDCDFNGSIVTDDTLIVGSSAKVSAEINAGVVEISGKVHGNIHAKNRVKIFTGGEVYGNIETPTVSMDEGVVFEGHCTRPPPAASGPQKAQGLGSVDVQRVLQGAQDVLGGSSQSQDAKTPSSSIREAELAL